MELQLAHELRGFKVVHCSASIDQCQTTLEENSSALNYVSPRFRAEAEVEVPKLLEGDIYTVGWVQAVTETTICNHYPSGVSNWEIPELNTGLSEAVNNGDGKEYPWFGIATEIAVLKGPSEGCNIRVCMEDCLSVTVSWKILEGKDQPDTLQKTCQDESFAAWLMVKNENSGEIAPLQGYSWRAVINISVDCSRKIGERAQLLEPLLQQQPHKFTELYIPMSAMSSPVASEAQKFVISLPKAGLHGEGMDFEEQWLHVQRSLGISHHSTASVDQCETVLKENSSVLNYTIPSFRAEAEVEVPVLFEGEIFTVGWVQAVTEMTFYNHYPSGVSSWEIPELDTGLSEAVNNGDGREYPWFGITTERAVLKGPRKEDTIRVYMEDNSSPTVSWAFPEGSSQPDKLQKVCVDLSSVAWLAIKNENSGEITPLRGYSWHTVINIAVDCSRKVGERAWLQEPLLQQQPHELTYLYVPKSTMTSPATVEAQKFVCQRLESMSESFRFNALVPSPPRPPCREFRLNPW